MDNSELQLSFDYFDRDKNGTIDFGEFCELLDALDSDSKMEEDARRIGFDIVDSDNNGTIDFEEFAGWWLGQD